MLRRPGLRGDFLLLGVFLEMLVLRLGFLEMFFLDGSECAGHECHCAV